MCEIILRAISLIIVGAVTCYIIPYLKKHKLYEAVKTAVQAAEQIYNKSGMGTVKFSYVRDWIKTNFKVTDEELKNIIESAVYEMKAGES